MSDRELTITNLVTALKVNPLTSTEFDSIPLTNKFTMFNIPESISRYMTESELRWLFDTITVIEGNN